MSDTENLLRVPLRLTGERGLAEDLVQETPLRAWRSFHRFEAETNCKAWLFQNHVERLEHLAQVDV